MVRPEQKIIALMKDLVHKFPKLLQLVLDPLQSLFPLPKLVYLFRSTAISLVEMKAARMYLK